MLSLKFSIYARGVPQTLNWIWKERNNRKWGKEKKSANSKNVKRRGKETEKNGKKIKFKNVKVILSHWAKILVSSPGGPKVQLQNSGGWQKAQNSVKQSTLSTALSGFYPPDLELKSSASSFPHTFRLKLPLIWLLVKSVDCP